VIAKTSTERVRALRVQRDKLGLVRLELYVHPGDHAELKRLALKLRRKREKPKP